MATLIFHLGLHKTGSTLLQGILRANRKRLWQAGVTPVVKRDPAMNRLMEALEARGVGRIGRGTAAAALVQALAAEAAAAGRPRLVFSHERLLGKPEGFYRERRRIPAMLQALARDHDIQVVMFVKRQDRMLESLYIERIHLGDAMSFDDYQAQHFPDGLLDYAGIVRLLAEVVPASRLTVLPFEMIQGEGGEARFVETFSRLAFGQVLDDLKRGKASNLSYCGRALTVALAVNPLLHDAEKAHFRRFLQRRDIWSDPAPARLFDDAGRAAVLARHAEGNRWLVETQPGFAPFAATYLPGR